LYQLANTLNSAHSPEEILNSIVEGVAKTMDAKACSLMLLTPDKEVLYRISAFGLSDWYLRIGPVQTDKSMSETLEGKTVIVLDAPNDSRIHILFHAMYMLSRSCHCLISQPCIRVLFECPRQY
jgi:two-component system, NtrC family, sensor kinase